MLVVWVFVGLLICLYDGLVVLSFGSLVFYLLGRTEVLCISGLLVIRFEIFFPYIIR